MDRAREKWNMMHVLSAVGLYGDDLATVIKTASREVVNDETGQRRRLMSEHEAGAALVSLLVAGRVVRTGYGQRARFDLNRDWRR